VSDKSITLGDKEVDLIVRLAETVDRSGLDYLSLDNGGWHLFFSKIAESAASVPASPVPIGKDAAEQPPLPETRPVTAPYVGIFKPNGDLQTGTPVVAGHVLGHVDTLDETHPVLAPEAGTIRQVLVVGQNFVEYGQPLMLLQAA